MIVFSMFFFGQLSQTLQGRPRCFVSKQRSREWCSVLIWHLRVMVFGRRVCQQRKRCGPQQFQRHRDVRRQACRWSNLLLRDFDLDVRLLQFRQRFLHFLLCHMNILSTASTAFFARVCLANVESSLAPTPLVLLDFRVVSYAPSSTDCQSGVQRWLPRKMEPSSNSDTH